MPRNHVPVRPPGDDLGDRRVLVVEDDPTVREVACDYLRSNGLIVDEAVDGISALKAAERTRPDLIVLDRMLPGISGTDHHAHRARLHPWTAGYRCRGDDGPGAAVVADGQVLPVGVKAAWSGRKILPTLVAWFSEA